MRSIIEMCMCVCVCGGWMETCERKDGGWIEKCERKDAWGGEEGGEVWRGVLERRTTNKVFNEM